MFFFFFKFLLFYITFTFFSVIYNTWIPAASSFFKIPPSLSQSIPCSWDTAMCCHSNLWGMLSLCIHRTRQQWGNYQEKINPFETFFKPPYYRTRLFQPRWKKKWEISMHLMCGLESHLWQMTCTYNRSRGGWEMASMNDFEIIWSALMVATDHTLSNIL